MSDYGGFEAILREAQVVDEESKRREAESIECPVCGLALAVNARGIRNCPMGHYRK